MTDTPRVTVPVEPIQRLILAADSYGVRYLDSDDMSAEAEELQAATEAMKDLIAAPDPDALRAIEMLRASEGDSVTILCNNPEATDLDDSMAVVCCGPWTDWKDRRFYGRDVSDALSKALAALRVEQKGGA